MFDENTEACTEAANGARALAEEAAANIKPQLYFFPVSEPSQAIRTVLDIAKAEYEIKNIDLANLEHTSEEFLKVNPFHQVPAYVEGAHTMIESASVLRYLAQKHGLEDVYPADPKQRHRVDAMLDFNASFL